MARLDRDGRDLSSSCGRERQDICCRREHVCSRIGNVGCVSSSNGWVGLLRKEIWRCEAMECEGQRLCGMLLHLTCESPAVTRMLILEQFHMVDGRSRCTILPQVAVAMTVARGWSKSTRRRRGRSVVIRPHDGPDAMQTFETSRVVLERFVDCFSNSVQRA